MSAFAKLQPPLKGISRRCALGNDWRLESRRQSCVRRRGALHGLGTKDQPGTTAQPKAVQWEERTIRIEGTGAVGYKVYDAQGKLVMVANRHAFTIPAELDLSQIQNLCRRWRWRGSRNL